MTAIALDMSVSFRFLEDEEFSKLEAIYKAEEAEPPLPQLSKVAVAEIDGEIIGFCPFELKPQIAMWVAPEYRGSTIWYRLLEMIEPLTHQRSTYVIATQPAVVKMCLAAGLREIQCRVFIKDVVSTPEEGS